jgi:hypothetical protein
MLSDDNMAESAPTGTRPKSWVSVAVQVVAALAVVGGVVLIGSALLGGSNDDSVPDSGSGRESLNLSCFAYRDLDGNGIYDLGDRPYAALRVDGTGSDEAVTATSNAGGFANFEMLLDGDGVLVARPGTYRFEALAPEGWELTSGQARSIDFVELEGSPAGIVASEQCEPFGLAPSLTIRGKVAAGEEVEIESELGLVDVEMLDDLEFRAPVAAGAWTVTISDGEMSESRRIDVVDAPVVMSQRVEGTERPAPLPNAVVVDFDGFTTANTITEIPNGYGGVDWANWVSTHRILYGGPGYVNGNTSGEFVAYNSSGHPAAISSDEPFDLVGGYFGVAWPTAELHDIVVTAWRGEALVATDSFRARTSGPLYFAADYRSVTRVEISSAANWQFVVDDLELRTAD